MEHFCFIVVLENNYVAAVQASDNRKSVRVRQTFHTHMVKVKVKQSRYRSGVAQRVPGI